ncbi:MAG: peroxiredoxin [Acidobacteria bacterium]|nr:MAG: peroxiredoxin [Acidobacteriota bacterium]
MAASQGPNEHRYEISLAWTGNLGEGTSGYRSYSRDFEVAVGSRPPISGSADPTFRGDPERYNPEEMLVAAVSSCHMLWYLHLCAVGHITITTYSDKGEGTLAIGEGGGGHFTSITLRPQVIAKLPDGKADDGSLREKALALHEEAHRLCFIANSLNVTVVVEPTVELVST